MYLGDNMNEAQQIVELIKKILNKTNTKVIGLTDLHTKASESGIDYIYSDELFEDVCRLLRDENVIAYIQGRGIFLHLRIVE